MLLCKIQDFHSHLPLPKKECCSTFQKGMLPLWAVSSASSCAKHQVKSEHLELFGLTRQLLILKYMSDDIKTANINKRPEVNLLFPLADHKIQEFLTARDA